MLHRLCWCCILTAAYLGLRRGAWWRPLLRDRRLMLMLCGSGALIGLNWFLFIWGVNAGHVVEVSLGYYINPLINVLMGTILLGERLQRTQIFAVALAALGVAWLTMAFGRPPWIALALGLTFGSYGLLRKLMNVESIPGLAMESTLLFPAAAAYLLWLQWQGTAAFAAGEPLIDTLLVAGGLVTALPLILFAYGARRIPYSSLGMIQYITPSMQLGIGVLVFGEPFDSGRLAGFACIWLALAIYTADGLRRLSRSASRPAG